jgi:anti-sigma factor RsiW
VVSDRPFLPCREFVAFLDDYLAGRLPPDRLQHFNDHLARCPTCVLYMRTYQESVRLGRASVLATDDPVPPEVPESLVRAILAGRPSTEPDEG